MTDKQPDALLLAEMMEDGRWQGMNDLLAAAELRRLHEENEALRAALSQPEPEPVAQIQVAEDYYAHAVLLGTVNPMYLDQAYLYLAQPQRPWQGLTDEEIKDALFTSGGWREAFRAIEAKLKEKNGI